MYKYIGRNDETELAYEKVFSTEEDAQQFGLDKIAIYPDYEIIPWDNRIDRSDIEPELGTEYDIDEELEEMGLDEEGQEGFDWSDESDEID